MNVVGGLPVLSAFVNAFRTPDLRKKLLFTIGIVVVYRLGCAIPTPGVSMSAIEVCQSTMQDNALFNMINLFSGNALLQLTIFALGIMPYITASIIVQLLTVVIPRFETLKQEGQSGTAKLTQYTRYLTVALAILQSTGLVAIARVPSRLFPGCQEDLVPSNSLWSALLMVVVMTAGTSIIMWFGEMITERGVSNGMSLLIFASIAAGFPGSFWTLRQESGSWFVFGLMIAMGLLVLVLVVFVEQAQRRIPVQYAKRMIGRRQYGGSSTYLPIKVNQAGVIPVIFASSLLYVPSLIAQFTPNPTAGWKLWIERNLLASTSPWHLAGFFALIVFFTYFYISITFVPNEVADNMKKFGGFVPGYRAGRATADYLEYVLSRLTFAGSLYLATVCILPMIALGLVETMSVGTKQNFPFAGTALLIIVGVGLETVKQVEAQLQQRHYEGFLR